MKSSTERSFEYFCEIKNLFQDSSRIICQEIIIIKIIKFFP